MAKSKSGILKYPKKPKKNATVGVLQRYIARCKEIDRKNSEKIKAETKRQSLLKQIEKIGR